MDKSVRYKGKIMTEKQYNRRMKQIETGKSRKKQSVNSEDESIVQGRRIVDFKVMAQHLYCTCCREIISLEHIEKENRKGLASIFTVRCKKCLSTTQVPTGNVHTGPKDNSSFDINTKVALGALHCGLGHTSIDNLFATLNVPFMTAKTFKTYEREIGPIVESVARSSCEEACSIEKDLTIAKVDELQKRLPDSIEANFLMPGRLTQRTEPLESLADIQIPAIPEPFTRIQDENNNETVRVFGSYDMGWNTRGSGFQYDSLSGTGHLIGCESGEVMDFATRNRKCRMCDTGHSTSDHDCRLNYFGTAKAMESDVASQLVNRSSILKSKNVEIGVFVGDNDSSSICAIRKEASHQIIKQSDKNHTSKGVKSLLYKFDKLKDPDKELTSDAIQYLHKCFTYAMAQHKGNAIEMAAAIKNIPYHAFNIHDSCGNWCGYLNNKENYSHRTVHAGFKNQVLFENLTSLFHKLSENVETYVVGGSTQGNESLNNAISRKAPKNVPYSCSESYDFRVACAVAQKNEGVNYLPKAFKKYNLSPGSHLSKLIERTEKYARIRRDKAKTPAFKLHSIELRKNRAQLRNQREAIEGQTYESNIGLFEMPAVSVNQANNVDEVFTFNSNNDHLNSILFFDLETGGFAMTDDILQIAVKCDNLEFNRYVSPTKPIGTKASSIHGLTSASGDLYLRGVKIQSFPVRVVLGEFIMFLKNIDKPCLFVAHNCNFDAPRLMLKLQECALTENFNELVIGFADSLALFKHQFPNRKGKGSLKLTTLAKELLHLPVKDAHDAMFDVKLLERLVITFFTYDELVKNIKKVDSVLSSLDRAKNAKVFVKALEPLSGVISKAMMKRLAEASISYEMLLNELKKNKENAISLLQQKVDGKATVVKSKKIIDNILDVLGR